MGQVKIPNINRYTPLQVRTPFNLENTTKRPLRIVLLYFEPEVAFGRAARSRLIEGYFATDIHVSHFACTTVAVRTL